MMEGSAMWTNRWTSFLCASPDLLGSGDKQVLPLYANVLLSKSNVPHRDLTAAASILHQLRRLGITTTISSFHLLLLSFKEN